MLAEELFRTFYLAFVQRRWFAGVPVFAAFAPLGAVAQHLPPPIEHPVLGKFGVELQSGRYGGLSVPLISIGGAGDSALSRTYAPQNGVELVPQASFGVRSRSNVRDPQYVNRYYDYVTYRYPGGSMRFRRLSFSSDPYEAEFNTGATLTQSANGLVFTNKYGLKIENNKLSYPDGREVWGWASEAGVDPGNSPIPIMRNNFGFLLRTSGKVTQAVNLARDYCDSDTSHLCQNLEESRSASVTGSSQNEMILRNAAGDTTSVQFTGITAFDGEPACVYNPTPGTPRCNGPTWTYYYPKRISGAAVKGTIEISYSRYGTPDSVSHDEILISQIKTNDLTANYINSYNPNGSWGGAAGHSVMIQSKVDGQPIQLAYTSSLGPVWPAASLNLHYVKDALSRITEFSQNDKGDISGVTYPEGNQIEYKFDSRYNVTYVIKHSKSVNEDDLVTQYVYPSSCSQSTQVTCNLPKAVIDPKGYRTDFTYNSRGQVLTETGPAPSTGAVRPVTTYTYTMRTAYVLDSSGNPVAAGSPISLLTRTSTCRTYVPCANTGDEIRTDYDYGPSSGPNNLLLRGVGRRAVDGTGQIRTLWTCYQYNYFGDRISETSARAGLNGCS